MRTNTKEVKTKIREHIADFYTANELKEEVKAIMNNDKRIYTSVYHAVLHMVQGGCFLCYHYQVQEFLNSLDINPTNKEYDTEKSWELYCHLIARDSQLIIKNA